MSMPALVAALPQNTLETITGNLLADGGISYSNLKRDGKITGNARYSMTMAATAHFYILQLFNNTYAQYSSTGLIPYPNITLPQHVGKEISQYRFNTRSLSLFSQLHSI